MRFRDWISNTRGVLVHTQKQGYDVERTSAWERGREKETITERVRTSTQKHLHTLFNLKSPGWIQWTRIGKEDQAFLLSIQMVPDSTPPSAIPTEYVHRVAMATFWHKFHHEGKISPGWWGGGGCARPPSITISTISYKAVMYTPA